MEMLILVFVSILFGALSATFYFTVIKEKPIILDYSKGKSKGDVYTDYQEVKIKQDTYYEEEEEATPEVIENDTIKDKIKSFIQNYKVLIVILLIFSCLLGIYSGYCFTSNLKNDIQKVQESKKIGCAISYNKFLNTKINQNMI